MKDWKAAVRGWERRGHKKTQAGLSERDKSYDLDEVYRAMQEKHP